MNPTNYYDAQTRSNTVVLPYENATNLSLSFLVSVGSTITVDWGDGVKVDLPANQSNQIKNFATPTTGFVTIYQADRLTRLMALAAYPFWKFNLPVLQKATGIINFGFTGNLNGNISEVPRSSTNILINGTGAVTGSLADVRNIVVSFQVLSSNSTVQSTAAQLQAIPGLQQFRLSGNSRHVGDIGLLPANMVIISLMNSAVPQHEITYTGKTWPANMRIVELLPAAGHGLTTAQVDALLHDLAQTTWFNEKRINIGGNNARRSFASDADVAALQAMGVTVTVNNPVAYYVRPAGTTYGAGTGLSYADAWSGVAGINQAAVNGNRLAICGNHFEAFTFDGIKLHIIGNDINQTGVVACTDSINVGVRVLNSGLAKITGLTVTDAVVSCIEFDQVTGSTKDCVVTGCGNQGLQHLHNFNMVHTNLYANDNTDDGISAHEAGYIKVIGGTFTNNEAGINVIAGCVVDIEGNPTFANNLYDLWAANATTNESCVITATGCTFPNQVLASNRAKVVLNNCNAVSVVVQNEMTAPAFLVANKSVIDSFTNSGVSQSVINNCRVNDIASIASGGLVTINDSYVKPVGVFDVIGTLRAIRTMFDGVDCTDHTIDCNSGSTLRLQYCILKNTISAKYALSIRTGTTIEALEALTVHGSSVGRGIYAQLSVTLRNSIITGLAQGVMSATAGQTVTLENCALYGNTANTAGSGSIVQNDAVNADPLFVDSVAGDYSLALGSTLRNAGEVLSENHGFLSVSWGDADTVPTITQKLLTTFNIGAI